MWSLVCTWLHTCMHECADLLELPCLRPGQPQLRPAFNNHPHRSTSGYGDASTIGRAYSRQLHWIVGSWSCFLASNYFASCRFTLVGVCGTCPSRLKLDQFRPRLHLWIRTANNGRRLLQGWSTGFHCNPYLRCLGRIGSTLGQPKSHVIVFTHSEMTS